MPHQTLVADWFAWSPGRTGRSAWRHWAGQPEQPGEAETIATLPMMLRRRLQPLDQALVAGALSCGTAAADARIILATRHGELQRTASILTALAAEEPPSPADFALSVHHALVGLLSIHTGNRHGHTAISAGRDSLHCGLLEAAASLANKPAADILLLFGEQTPPPPYDSLLGDEQAPQPFALVLRLSSREGLPLDEAILLKPGIGGTDFMRQLLAAEAQHGAG